MPLTVSHTPPLPSHTRTACGAQRQRPCGGRERQAAVPVHRPPSAQPSVAHLGRNSARPPSPISSPPTSASRGCSVGELVHAMSYFFGRTKSSSNLGTPSASTPGASSGPPDSAPPGPSTSASLSPAPPHPRASARQGNQDGTAGKRRGVGFLSRGDRSRTASTASLQSEPDKSVGMTPTSSTGSSSAVPRSREDRATTPDGTEEELPPAVSGKGWVGQTCGDERD